MALKNLPTLEEVRIWKARKALAHFTQRTKPDYLMGWVHREICDVLDQFLDDVKAKRSPRLIITMPPRSGKSELVSRRFPAYVFGRYPDCQVIATSYSADLSQRFNRDVQRIIDDEKYREVFPETTLNGSRVKVDSRGSYIRTSDLFEIVGHTGAYRSCGVGGGITGQGADILIIDDPIKDRAEANSATVRQSIWDWYTSTAYTRLSPGGGVIVMATRWHVDDLIGRLTKNMKTGDGDDFKIINYPAIAEHDEPHRKEGEALHPERYDVNQLLKIKTTIGSRDWNALYQQHPIIEGGGLLRTEWFKRFESLPNLKYRIIASDTALKTKEHNDYSVFGVAGVGEDGNLYILDILRGKWESPELIKRAKDFWRKHKALDSALGKLRSFYVEDKASGTGLIQTIKRGEESIPIIPVERTIDKLTRYQDVFPLIEAGRVFLPSSAPWVNDFLTECEQLQADMKHPHDDQIDVLADLINQTIQSTNFSWQKIFKR